MISVFIGIEAFYSFFFSGVILLSKNIYVGNLSWSTSNSDLNAMFSQYGQVTSANVIEDRDTGRSRGFGFVEMDEDGARKAIQALNGTDFQGRNLKVNEAQPRESRSRY
ncbi:RNA-binding protein [Desulfomicrobium salsuginis]